MEFAPKTIVITLNIIYKKNIKSIIKIAPKIFFMKNIIVLYIAVNTLYFSENKITKYRYPKKLKRVPAMVNMIIHNFSTDIS